MPRKIRPKLNALSKRAWTYVPLAVSLMLFGYFSIHFTSGDHGLEARDRLTHRVQELNQSLSALQRQRKFHEQHLALLQNERPSTDLADELARKTLQYAHPDDFVLFER